jgi:hypothetical protein
VLHRTNGVPSVRGSVTVLPPPPSFLLLGTGLQIARRRRCSNRKLRL